MIETSQSKAAGAWRGWTRACLTCIVLALTVAGSLTSCALFYQDAKLKEIRLFLPEASVVSADAEPEDRRERIPLVPAFDPVKKTYAVTLLPTDEQAIIEALPFDGACIVKIRAGDDAAQPLDDVDGLFSTTVDLAPATENVFTLITETENGKNSAEYTLTINRPPFVAPPADDPRLQSLNITGRSGDYGRLIKVDEEFVPLTVNGTFDWGFDADHYRYVAVYPQARSSIDITPNIMSRHGKIWVIRDFTDDYTPRNDDYVATGNSKSRGLSIESGGVRAQNPMTVYVLAQNGIDDAYYHLRFYREPSDNVELVNLGVTLSSALGSDPIDDFPGYKFFPHTFPRSAVTSSRTFSVAGGRIVTSEGADPVWHANTHFFPYHGVPRIALSFGGHAPRRYTTTLHYLDDAGADPDQRQVTTGGLTTENLRVGLNHVRFHVEAQNNFVDGWEDPTYFTSAWDTTEDYYTRLIRAIGFDVMADDNARLTENIRGLVQEGVPYYDGGTVPSGVAAALQHQSTVTLYLPNDGHAYGGSFIPRLVVPPAVTAVTADGTVELDEDPARNVVSPSNSDHLLGLTYAPSAAYALDADHVLTFPGDPAPVKTYSVETRTRLIRMVDLAGGEFAMGDDHDSFDGTYQATVSPFSIGVAEVSYQEWRSVVEWAKANGYSFRDDRLGALGQYEFLAGGDSDEDLDAIPVHNVYWSDVLKWCNALSEMEGLTPVYHLNSSFTSVYRSGDQNLSNANVNWAANGYRLPTEVEWEFAARNRGEEVVDGYHVAGTTSDGQAGDYAWFYDNSGEANATLQLREQKEAVETSAWDVGGRSGLNDRLYDMSGNVAEWVWDRHAQPHPAGALTDYRGPNSGNQRVIKGGSYKDRLGDGLHNLRPSWRVNIDWNARGDDYIGFRVARSIGHYQ